MDFLKRVLIFIFCFFFIQSPVFAAEKNYVLRFNTVAGPQQPEVLGLRVFADELNRLSNGRIKVQIFHSGQLGNQQTQIIGVMRGTIEMTFADPNTLAQFDRRVGVLGAAYLFRDINHMYKVMLGPIGKEYFERLAREHRLRPLDVWYLGTRQLNLKDKAVYRPDDMKGLKLRMPDSPLWIAMGRALGANPTPLGFEELYLALKTGVIDGQDNPLPADYAQKFYEVTKYIVLTNHQIGMLWPSINEDLWQGLPEKYKAWIIEALHRARDYQNKIVLDSERRLVEEFRSKYGMKIIYPDIEAFKKNAKKIYSDFEDEWGRGVYEKIQGIK